eukprot:4956337-Pyramimonas_sp.AAC.1
MRLASSKAFRECRLHRLFDRTLARMRPKNIAHDIRAKVARARGQEAEFTVERQSRACMVIAAFKRGPQFMGLEAAQ